MTKEQLFVEISTLRTEISTLKAALDARFAELVQANKWARIYREQRDLARGGSTNKRGTSQVVDFSGCKTPEERRERMAKAKNAVA